MSAPRITVDGVPAVPTQTVVRSPSRSPTPQSGRPRANSSSQLQSEVEAERAEMLTDVKEKESQRFEAVDHIHQQLEQQTANVMDMFKRDVPKTVGQPQTHDQHQYANDETLKAPVPTDKRHVVHTSTTGKVTREAINTEDNYNIHVDSGSVEPVVVTTQTFKPSAPVVASVERERPMYVSGAERNTAIQQSQSAVTLQPIVNVNASAVRYKRHGDDKDATIASLSLALVQARQAYRKVVDQLHVEPVAGTSGLGADSRGLVSGNESATVLSVVPVASDDQSLQSYLTKLPTKRGQLMVKYQPSETAPPQYQQRYVTLTSDSLTFSDSNNAADNNDQNSQKIDLNLYWLVERAEDKVSSKGKFNYAASHSQKSKAFTNPMSPLSPMAGHSLFRMENGAYVLRLVPILHDPDQPQKILEPTPSQIIELTGMSESSIAESPDSLTSWVDAINLRISLLALLHDDNHTALLAHGGRHILSFLCSIDNHSLIIENQYLDSYNVLSYFKESLVHRRNYSIVLRNVALDDHGLRVLSEILMMNDTIQHIDLSYNAITDSGISYLAPVFDVNNGIQSLKLDYNRITGDGLSELSQSLAQAHTVTGLSIKGNQLTDESINSFVSNLLQQSKTDSIVRHFALIDFSANHLTNGAITGLGSLLTSFSLGSLRLSSNELTDSGIAALCVRLAQSAPNKPYSLTSLTLLDLSYNKLTEASLTPLAGLARASHAMKLDLSGNQIGVNGLKVLLGDGSDSKNDISSDFVINGLSFSRAPVPITSDAHAAIESGNAMEARPVLAKKLSIVKESDQGAVEVIDTLHADDKQLGRAVNEVTNDAKDNSKVTQTTIERVSTATPGHKLNAQSLFDRLVHRKNSRSESDDHNNCHTPQSSSSTTHIGSDAMSEKEVLLAPPTAASTELLVDGGKTADPRHASPSSSPTRRHPVQNDML